MEALFASQAKFKSEAGLSKMMLTRNKNYKPHGRKALVRAMARHGFQPTMPFVYCHKKKFHQTGLSHFNVPVGGRLRVQNELVKRLNDDGNLDPEGTQDGQVTAEDQQNDMEWICEVDIGTPAQKLMLDFDTGSSDLWVFSTELPSASQKGHTAFNPKESSTWKKLSGDTWKISYGDSSSASGDVGTDNINLGGLIVKNQAIELAQKASSSFLQGTSDGLLGLAWPSINTVTPKPVATPVANMIEQGIVPDDLQLFTTALYAAQDNKTSFYTFGFIDEDLVKASGTDVTWTDIDNSQGFWQFPSTSAIVNGNTVSRDGNTAIADTGTTLCLVDDDVVKALYSQINGAKYDSTQGGYLIPKTNAVSDLPDFSVAVGDETYTIQKENLLLDVGDEDDPNGTGNSYYFGAVQSRGSMTFDIFGDVFLKSVYAIWDQGKQRFGLVPKLQGTQVAPGDSSSTSAGQ